MRLARGVFFGLAVAGVIIFLSSAAFAQTAPATTTDTAAKQAKREARMKLLQDSAAALQQSNPGLSKQLSDLVTEETSQPKGQMEGKEKIAKDSPEWKAKHDARMQLFKDASAALAQSRPDLAKGLDELTVPKQKTEMKTTTEEKSVKTEVVETVTPKAEQPAAK